MPGGIYTQGTFVMHAVPLIANPFALLTDPEAIFRAVEASPRLESLNRRVCRPLDRAHREGNDEGPDAAPHDKALVRDADRFFD
jgi:hypothetical protein